MPLHPLIVHFPIALLFVAFALYIVNAIKTEQDFGLFAFILHITGLLFCVAAILSGDASVAVLIKTDAIHSLSKTHETLGMLCAWGFGMLAIWAYLRRGSKILMEKIGFLVLYLGVVIALGYTAHLGGKMVYEEGAGIVPMKPILEKQLIEEKADSLLPSL